MKPLTCEMCGSTDVVREEDLYVCRHCGTKYTPEAARKIMIEGPVDVSGSTVKVDTSQELENLYTLARRARDEGNQDDAAKYYEMILLRNPDSWEANFYSPLCLYKHNCPATLAALHVRLPLVVELIWKTIPDRAKRHEAFREIAERLVAFPVSSTEMATFWSELKDSCDAYGDDSEVHDFFDGLLRVTKSLASISDIFKSFRKKLEFDFKLEIDEHSEEFVNAEAACCKHVDMIRKCDPDYTIPSLRELFEERNLRLEKKRKLLKLQREQEEDLRWNTLSCKLFCILFIVGLLYLFYKL